MSDKHPYRTGIIVTVIGALISTFLLKSFIPAAWQACISAFIWLFRSLLSTVSVPVWLIVTISILVIFIIFIMNSILGSFKRNDAEYATWRDYTKDDIMGITWRWRYGPHSADIERLWCFCPHDDTELVSEGIYSESFLCETCKMKFGPFEDSRGDLLGMVKRQIHRKLRSGDWKAIVERLKSKGQHP